MKCFKKWFAAGAPICVCLWEGVYLIEGTENIFNLTSESMFYNNLLEINTNNKFLRGSFWHDVLRSQNGSMKVYKLYKR